MFFSTSTPVPNTNTPYDPLINKVDSDIEAASNNENYGTLPALSFSTTGEATAWLLAVLGYIGTITAPAAVSASFYASLTVDATLSNSDSPYAKILWSLVKAAAVVPTILATNSAQTLFSRLVSRYQKDAMLGLMKEVVHPEMLLPLGIAIISAFSTAYVAECRNSTSGLFSDSIVDWFTYAAFISATITNTRLIRDILIKNIKASWIQDPQGLKKILRVILNDLSAEVSALENEINHKLIEKHITKGTSRKELNENLQLDEALLTPSEKKTLISSDTALEKLIKLHVLIKGQNNIQKLDFKLLTAWKNLSAKNQEDFFVEKSFCVKSGLWFAAIMAVIAARYFRCSKRTVL